MILYKIEIGHPDTNQSTKKYYTDQKQFIINLKRTKEKFKKYGVGHIVTGCRAQVNWKAI